jgi:isopenicillin N synthase-like dioxygenase
MKIPTIDFQTYDEADPKAVNALGQEMNATLSEIGFIAVTNLGISPTQLQQVFDASKRFFSLPIEVKQCFAYTSAKENFGFQGLLAEHLDPQLPADLKETFTMRDPAKYLRADSRWPSSEFRDRSLAFYQETLSSAKKVLHVFAAALNQEAHFFEQHFTGENISLRFLYYPSSGAEVQSQQLGAGAHTDYGVITLLFQDNVGGLEVKDKHGIWHPIDYIENAILINTGDLMERWTNGRYQSTMHRVQPKIGQQPRYSIALFMDPDSVTNVSVLDSCVSAMYPAQYPPITAGEHIQEKLRASHAY